MLYHSEYKSHASITITKLIVIPTIYVTEKSFSEQVEIKKKKQNRLKCVDALMRGAL